MDIEYQFKHTPRPDPAEFRNHTHNAFELLYFLDGAGFYMVEGTPYEIRPQTLMIMRPGEMHYAAIRSDHAYRRVCVNFTEALLEDLDPTGLLLHPFYDRELGENNQYEERMVDIRFIESCLFKMDKADPMTDYGYLLMRSNLYAALCEVYKGHQCVEELELSNCASGDLMYEVIRYINQNLNADLSLPMLEKRFFISRQYLNQRFKKATGTTVWDYILTKRLIKANQLMDEGEPATAAAFASGFSDYSSFYRAYKAKFQVSPRQRGSRPSNLSSAEVVCQPPVFHK